MVLKEKTVNTFCNTNLNRISDYYQKINLEIFDEKMKDLS